jgi:hypothetical protein
VLDDAPAKPVDEVVMVGKAVQVEVGQGCWPALCPGLVVVWFAPAGGLVAAAGPLAVLVAQDDGAAQVIRDVIGGADVEDEAVGVEWPPEEAGAQEPGAYAAIATHLPETRPDWVSPGRAVNVSNCKWPGSPVGLPRFYLRCATLLSM